VQRKHDWSWLRDWRVSGFAAVSLLAGFLIGLGVFGKPWGLPPAWGIPTWAAGHRRWYHRVVRRTSILGAITRSRGNRVTSPRRSGTRPKHGELLRLQGEQLDLQCQQLAEQCELSGRQSEVFQLQADELRESLAERKRDAEDRRIAQASHVFVTQPIDGNSVAAWIGVTAR
jgi:hypothetical protein